MLVQPSFAGGSRAISNRYSLGRRLWSPRQHDGAEAARAVGKTLARVAREQGLDQERLRRWVSFLALCGALDRAIEAGILSGYYLKGGVAMELRFAEHARATKDLDLGMEGARGRSAPISKECIGSRIR
jgi:hypothetical protein